MQTTSASTRIQRKNIRIAAALIALMTLLAVGVVAAIVSRDGAVSTSLEEIAIPSFRPTEANTLPVAPAVRMSPYDRQAFLEANRESNTRSAVSTDRPMTYEEYRFLDENIQPDMTEGAAADSLQRYPFLQINLAPNAALPQILSYDQMKFIEENTQLDRSGLAAAITNWQGGNR